MATRRALLIGIEQYEGPEPAEPGPVPRLWNVAAAPTDVAAVSAALKRCGYEITVAEADEISNAAFLERRIRSFIEESGKSDDVFIYFTGHGLTVDGKDCIVPGGTTYEEARSAAHHVSTDLSTAVMGSSADIVVFAIDACRHSGVEDWGSSNRKGDEARFVRFFGCSASDGYSYTIDDDPAGPPRSVFSTALVEPLQDPSIQELSALLQETQKGCAEIAARHQGLSVQHPRLDVGDVSGESDQSLHRRMFTSETRDDELETGWPFDEDGFDPASFHCLVISSEHERVLQPERTLASLVNATLPTGKGDEVWQAFRSAAVSVEVVSGVQRPLGDFSADAIRITELSVVDIYSERTSFHTAARAVTEADLVVFDVTGWEPGVMLLIGVRSAARRGVSICSHGGGWVEGEPLPDLPFGLRDLSIHSHTKQGRVGNSLDEDRLIRRARSGFEQMARQPDYLDLPAYDALRRLGPEYESSGTIGINVRTLVLCPYDDEYEPNWGVVRPALERALAAAGLVDTDVQRLIDFGSPQLVSQSLFEQIRRTESCLFDWTGFSGSVFIELGVRLAVSPFGAVQIIDAAAPTPRITGADGSKQTLGQIEGLRRRIGPIQYQYEPGTTRAADPALATAVEQMRRRGQDVGLEGTYNEVHRVVRDALPHVARRIVPVHVALAAEANALHHPQQGTRGAPQVLFYGSPDIKRDSEDAALECRLAAWFYLRDRHSAGSLASDDPTFELFRSTGAAAAASLYSGDDHDVDLALTIHDQVKRSEIASDIDRREGVRLLLEATNLERQKGDALQDRRPTEAVAAWEEGLVLLQRAEQILRDRAWNDLETFEPHDVLPSDQYEIAGQLAETLGQQGGMLRRLPASANALGRFEQGSDIEERFFRKSTYNRVNFIKESLKSGDSQFQELADRLDALATDLESNLRTDPSVRDSGWAWADLGDCRLLLGNLDGAVDAYSNLMTKADSSAPRTTTKILDELAAAMVANGDPRGRSLTDDITELRDRLTR